MQKTFWDRLGIGLSGLCAIHCLLFPVLVALLPLVPWAESVHAWTHPVLFLLIAPTVWLALREKRPGRRPIALLLCSGLAVIALAWFLHDVVGMWGEAIITLAGSALLIRGHWLNYRGHRARERHG
ncbi:MAG: MerC domain-containing protein [Balneolaceae bacterium]|nr:MerC domain-containing protein [Balneolaceae bacterium]